MDAETISQGAEKRIQDLELAFQALRLTVAGSTAAIHGFAAQLQELHGRDYGPDLAKTHDGMEKLREAINILDRRPAMALTPAVIASQIESAAEQSRAKDHEAWISAKRGLDQTAQLINDRLASALERRTQLLWIAGATAIALIVGFALGTVVPDRIAQSVPASWNWPERRAVNLLQRNGWDAGMHLLQVSDPERYNGLGISRVLERDQEKRRAAAPEPKQVR